MVLLVLVHWLHLLAALFWIGGQLFLLSVILPVLRAQLPRTDQLRLIAAAGRCFAVYSLAALGVLITTDLYLAFTHGLRFQGLAGDTWEQVLLVKVLLVVAVIPITAVHSAIYGGHLERLGVATDPNPALQAERLRVQRRSRVLSSATLVLSLSRVCRLARLSRLRCRLPSDTIRSALSHSRAVVRLMGSRKRSTYPLKKSRRSGSGGVPGVSEVEAWSA